MKTTTTTALVPLTVEVRGEIVSSNLAEFHRQVTSALSLINYSPSTDEEFAKADELAKGLKAIEESVAAARKKALDGSADLAATLQEMAEVEQELGNARRMLAARVKERKSEVKEERIATALLKIPHPKRGTFRPFLVEAIKGKSSLVSIDAALAKTVQEITLGIEKCRAILTEFESEHGCDLIADRSELELRDPEHLPEALANRMEQKRLRDEKAAADQALREAEAREKAAKLNEQPKPVPPASKAITITSLPMPGDSKPRSVSEEWAAFRLAVSAIADQLKAERADLIHEVNQRRASEFVRLLNEAWRAVQKIN